MNERKITVLGIGGAGCRIMRHIKLAPGADKLRLLVLDSDTGSLEESGLPPECRIIAGMNLRSGRGCGGNEILGRSAVAVERPRLGKILEGTEILLIIGGLGGGLCTGIAVIVRVDII